MTYYVTCTDKVGSNCLNTVSKMVVECENYSQAKYVYNLWESFSNTRYVNIAVNKPHYPSYYEVRYRKFRDEFSTMAEKLDKQELDMTRSDKFYRNKHRAILVLNRNSKRAGIKYYRFPDNSAHITIDKKMRVVTFSTKKLTVSYCLRNSVDFNQFLKEFVKKMQELQASKAYNYALILLGSGKGQSIQVNYNHLSEEVAINFHISKATDI